MSKITLRDYQAKAVKFTQETDFSLLCMRVGSGKTVCAMFALREFLNRDQVDKAIVACTKSSVSVFQKDFKEKAGIDVELVETLPKLFKFLEGKKKVCLIKHGMFEKMGGDVITIKKLEKLNNAGLRVALVIDEAHKIQNPDGVAQRAFHRVDGMFDKIVLLTATPYSSCLSQFWGLICLIHPEIWPTKRSFYFNYIDEVVIRDPRTHRPIRKEKVRYKNLADFRKKIESFTYFYYPSIPLVHTEHHTKLSPEHLAEYNELCKGVIKEEDKEKYGLKE